MKNKKEFSWYFLIRNKNLLGSLEELYSTFMRTAVMSTRIVNKELYSTFMRIMHWQLLYCKLKWGMKIKGKKKQGALKPMPRLAPRQVDNTEKDVLTSRWPGPRNRQLAAHLLLPRVMDHALLNLSLWTCHAMLGARHFYCRRLWHSISRVHLIWKGKKTERPLYIHSTHDLDLLCILSYLQHGNCSNNLDISS
jgi:hypothetical protein